MKLRLRGNSVRFRLGTSEVERVRLGFSCHETVSFPGGNRLEYILGPSEASEILVSFTGSCLRVEVPASDLNGWCGSDQVALSAEISLPDGPALYVLIEKDFRCLDPGVLEDQSDTFENPLEMHSACEHG